jgi:AraC-like DNA-binding protein
MTAKQSTDSSLGPWVRSGAMRGIVSYLESIEIEPVEVIGEDNIRMAEASDPYRKVDLITVLRAFQKVVAVSGRSDLGLELGLNQHMEEWGPFGYLFLNAPSVAEALKDLCRYSPALQSHASFDLISTGDSIGVAYVSNHPEMAGWELDSEISITFLMSIVNSVAAHKIQPREIWFDHQPLCDMKYYRKHLGLEPHFNAPSNRVLYYRAVGEKNSPRSDAGLYMILRRHIRDLAVAEREEEQLLNFVRNNIGRGLTQGTATLEHIAAEIGLEPRTLQRRLKAQDSSFQALMDEVRLARARYLLEKTSLSITDVALELGYAEASVFIRAFKRLTGASPKQYRKAAR